jgi:hypothetical protein
MLRDPGQLCWPEKDRSQRLIVCRPVKVKLCQGVGPCCSALQQEVDKSTNYPGGRERQGTPYSHSNPHTVLPLACIGLGNIEWKYSLICL